MASRVGPSEAHERMTKNGAKYVDVRTVAEFDGGHPTGAYNVPLLVDGPGGRGPNAGFLDAMLASFAKDAPLVVGCLAGGRATSAAEMLEGAGYTDVTIQAAGWGGVTDPFGRVTEPGWKAAGLPTATKAEAGHSWAELGAKR